LNDVVPGAWYFDYGADRIYFVDNPAGRRVEASVLARAFGGAANNVTIRGLIVEKYATPLQEAAVRADGGTGWIIEGTEARWNHAIGIFTGTRTIARRNHAHHNGQQGMGGTGEGAIVEDNQIAYNNVPKAMAYGWTAGGTKWHRTRNLVLRRNHVHHNLGPGLWADIDNFNTLMEHNRVDANGRNGIFFEISYRAIIRFNSASGNGHDHAPDSLRGGGIAVTSSPDVEIYGNTLKNNRVGFAMNQDEKGSGALGPHVMKNLFVHDNTVTQPTGYTGFDVNVADQSYYTSRNNRFARNTYILGSNPKPFWWANGPRTPAEWRRFGQN
jgi:Right handed beta helix region